MICFFKIQTNTAEICTIYVATSLVIVNGSKIRQEDFIVQFIYIIQIEAGARIEDCISRPSAAE